MAQAKASKTIIQTMHYPPQYETWFAATQTLFNQVAAFYFDVIQAHEQVLTLSSQNALTALETLTHATAQHPHPVMPLAQIAQDIPAMFRRAAIHVALGTARAFSTSLRTWRARKEKALGKKKRFAERPPVPPRTWNRSPTFYAGQWKERTRTQILLKVWTGTCWSWIKVHLLSRDIPAGSQIGSPSLVRHGSRWRLHTPVEKTFPSPPKVSKQLMQPQTRICAVDLNLDHHLAVCTIQDAEGSILATTFVGEGARIHGFRKQQLGRIARNRSKTGIIAQGQQDNAALWTKIRHVDEQVSHLVSARIVQFASRHEASLLVFEYLGSLKPQTGRYSRRGNMKRAYWMKGRIFQYAKYKAWNAGIITSRVSPRTTSRECARCHGLIARYDDQHGAEGYTPGAPLAYCPACGMKGHADRNASIVIGQRLLARTNHQTVQEKPRTPLRAAERDEKSSGVARSQDAICASGPSSHGTHRHGAGNGHGTAYEEHAGMAALLGSIPPTLRSFNESSLRDRDSEHRRQRSGRSRRPFRACGVSRTSYSRHK